MIGIDPDDGVTTVLRFGIGGEIADRGSRIYALRAQRDEQGHLKVLANNRFSADVQNHRLVVWSMNTNL